MTKAAVIAFPPTESLRVLRNGTPVSLTPKVRAVIEMILENAEAMETITHGTVEVHCHPNQWVLQVYQRTAKAFRKLGIIAVPE